VINVLLDTNILIDFEDTERLLSATSAEIKRKASGLVRLYIHPAQYEDIERDRDTVRKNLLLSRIQQYELLKNPPIPNESELVEFGWANHKPNDQVDNALLYATVRGAVHHLVTMDIEIHKKAAKASLSELVLNLDSFANTIKSLETPESITPVAVTNQYLYQIDLSKTFFDSLRESYLCFDEWFTRSSRGHRQAWVVYSSSNDIQGICIYKEEDGEQINNSGFTPSGKTLKLCTFKVSEECQGSKLGERLLYSAFKYAKDIEAITVYIQANQGGQIFLISFLKSFGFEECGRYNNDTTFIKYLAPPSKYDEELSKSDYLKRYFPSYKLDETVSGYIVPIQPQYFESLFPDKADFANSLFGHMPDMYKSESNTIRKAYLCGSNIKRIEPGDLVLFYRSGDRKSIEVLAGVINAEHMTDIEKIRNEIKDRTVFSDSEIERLLDEHNGTLLVIKFDLIEYFANPITFSVMNELGISVPQSIISVTNVQLQKLLEGVK
jgi:GNAT superfamily N-acetyltransferase